MENKQIEAYMLSYLYELETALNKNTTVLSSVNYQADEANTDTELKQAIQKFIKEKYNTIKLIKNVIIDSVDYYINSEKFLIKDVYIPEDLTDDDKVRIRSLRGTSVLPDVVLLCSFDGEDKEQFIELKSTKEDKIPGSSVQQVEPDGWVLFVKHNTSVALALTGKYKNSISGTMRFPDRSPRPEVSFKTLQEWLGQYRIFNGDSLEFKTDKLSADKAKILTDWQKVLSERWLEVLKNDKKDSDPWFSNNIRKFASDLFDYYYSLTDGEKKEFVKKIKANIKDESSPMRLPVNDGAPTWRAA